MSLDLAHTRCAKRGQALRDGKSKTCGEIVGEIYRNPQN